MTAIYVKKIKKERASGSTWAEVTESKGKQATEAASWKWEAYPAETKLKKATMTKEIWLNKKKKKGRLLLLESWVLCSSNKAISFTKA